MRRLKKAFWHWLFNVNRNKNVSGWELSVSSLGDCYWTPAWDNQLNPIRDYFNDTERICQAFGIPKELILTANKVDTFVKVSKTLFTPNPMDFFHHKYVKQKK